MNWKPAPNWPCTAAQDTGIGAVVVRARRISMAILRVPIAEMASSRTGTGAHGAMPKSPHRALLLSCHRCRALGREYPPASASDNHSWWITFPALPGVVTAANSPMEIARKEGDALAAAVGAGAKLPPPIEEGRRHAV